MRRTILVHQIGSIRREGDLQTIRVHHTMVTQPTSLLTIPALPIGLNHPVVMTILEIAAIRPDKMAIPELVGTVVIVVSLD